MTNIQRANSAADRLSEVGYTHPMYERVALRGILHALLALHEQNEIAPVTETKPAPTRTRATKETSK